MAQLVLQGFLRQVKQHRINANGKHIYGAVASDAISVFPVGRHGLTLNGDYDGHISLTAEDVQRSLEDLCQKADAEAISNAVISCLNALEKMCLDEKSLFDDIDRCLVVQTSALAGKLRERISSKLEK